MLLASSESRASLPLTVSCHGSIYFKKSFERPGVNVVERRSSLIQRREQGRVRRQRQAS